MKFLKISRITSPCFRVLLAILLYLPFLIACADRALGSPSDEEMTAKLVEGAKKEGQMSFYFSMKIDEADILAKKFQKKYPFIKVELYRAGSASLLTRVLAEDQAKKNVFDVLATGAITLEFLKRKKIFAKYLSPQRKFYPEQWLDPEGYWASIWAQLNVMAYNTQKVSPEAVPRTYEDLLDRKWKGSIVMDSGTYYWFAKLLKMMGEKKGLEYMQKLSEQNIQFRTGRTLSSQLLAAGEHSIAIPVFNSTIGMQRDKGAKIEWAAIEPIVAEVNAPAISAHARHPNAARLFFDFLLSAEGQETISSFYYIPCRSDVDAIQPRMKARGLKILPFDPSIADNYEEYIKLHRRILMKR